MNDWLNEGQVYWLLVVNTWNSSLTMKLIQGMFTPQTHPDWLTSNLLLGELVSLEMEMEKNWWVNDCHKHISHRFIVQSTFQTEQTTRAQMSCQEEYNNHKIKPLHS